MDGKRLFFRDIHKMCDGFEEPFLDKVCTGWQALYYTPPVVDQWMFMGKGASGVMSLGGEFASIETAADGDALFVVRISPERSEPRSGLNAGCALALPGWADGDGTPSLPGMAQA